jgi:hypothetical protein
MNALNFTYVLMSTGSEKIWVAGPSTVVKVGDKLSIPSGMEMPNFESKTLNRTFDMIYFVDYLGGASGADGMGHGASFSGHPPMGGQPGSAPRTLPAGHPPLGMKKVDGKDAGGIDLTGIEKVAGGRTVAEIYAQKAELKGTRVKLRAKVVKFSTQIMERNWLHIQDGTGAEETADLTVTAPVATVAKVGDTVLVEGTLAVDKDFGAGYAYAVILEDAQVTVEPPAGK